MLFRYIGPPTTNCRVGKIYDCTMRKKQDGFTEVLNARAPYRGPLQVCIDSLLNEYWKPITEEEEKAMLEFEVNSNDEQMPSQPAGLPADSRQECHEPDEVHGVLEYAAAPQQPLVNAAGPGYVLVPLETYNELLIKVNAASRAISFERRTYSLNDTIEVTVDRKWLYDEAMKQINDWFDKSTLDKYDIVSSADQVLVMSSTIARAKAKEQTTPGKATNANKK